MANDVLIEQMLMLGTFDIERSMEGCSHVLGTYPYRIEDDDDKT
jgi:hypothetical protein